MLQHSYTHVTSAPYNAETLTQSIIPTISKAPRICYGAHDMADDELSAKTPNPDDYEFDLNRHLKAIVSVRTRVPEDALTASMLGTEREGHGVVISDDGLILTIGYIITEASSVWIIDYSGKTLQGHVVAYDQQSGFGLVQPLGRWTLPALTMGNSSTLKTGQSMILAASGGLSQAKQIRISGISEFAGYWEYLLDAALFTVPAHPSWGGSALIGEDGKLYGIGSLILQTVDANNATHTANMVIPIGLLPPILDDLLRYGRRNRPARPWLGWFVHDTQIGPVIAAVADDGPAELAGLDTGDLILQINGQPVNQPADLFQSVWDSGDAGTNITVNYERDGTLHSTIIESIDRNSLLKKAAIH